MSQSSDKPEIVFDSNEDSTPLTDEQVAMLEEEWPINILHDRQTIQWISNECLIPAYKIMKWDTQRRAALKDPLEGEPTAEQPQGATASAQGSSPSQLNNTGLTYEQIATLEKRWPIFIIYGQRWIEWFSKETNIPVHKIVKWDTERKARRDNQRERCKTESLHGNQGAHLDEDNNIIRITKQARQHDSEVFLLLHHNGPLATSSSGGGKHFQTRQVNEWVFSSLVQPPISSSGGEEKIEDDLSRRRGKSIVSYRSLHSQSSSSNMYTNYYRNPNIYAQTARRVDGGSDTKTQSTGRRHNGSDADEDSPLNIPGPGIEGWSRRRASSSLLPARNHLNSSMSFTDTFSATSKMPEVLGDRDTGTTGLSRTAPATDPSLLASERPTSTQEMQIGSDDNVPSVTTDEIELDSRREFRRRGKKSGREMGAATESLKIIFPGSSTAPSDTVSGATTRPYITMGNSLTVNPFDAQFIDGWMRLFNIRKNALSFGGTKKSSIASDQSADAKIILLLTINGTPKCAGNDGYCENIDTYPRSYFNKVLNQTLSPDIFKDIFGETTDNKTVELDVEFKLRHEYEDTPLCSVREHTIYPKAAPNRKGKYMYIVNHDEYLQGIRVETCTRANDDCMFTEGHLPGYSSMCKQKFIYKKLLAFTPEGKAMPDTFRLPSCCVCYVRSMFITDRINHRINPGDDVGNPDVQTTSESDDSTWGPLSSTEFPLSHSDDVELSPLPLLSSSSTESGNNSFPTTINPGGQLENRAKNQNQTASRRLNLSSNRIFNE